MQTDLLVINGKIHTMDDARPIVSALAITNGKVVDWGTSEELLEIYEEHSGVVDLGGNTVVPGFIEAHIHFLYYGQSLSRIDLMEVPSLAEALQRVRVRAEETPAGRWLLGRGWDQSVWGDGVTFPSKDDLDEITTEHPVFLSRKCGHIAWANSKALELAGVTAQTADPAGGEIERSANGEPTGILKENAIDLVRQAVPEPTFEENLDAMRLAQDKLHSMGVTSMHLMGGDTLAGLQTLHDANELKLRTTFNIPVDQMDAAIQLGLRPGFGDDMLRIGAIKIFADGSLGGRTALMIDPYENQPDNRGIAVTSREQMFAYVEKAARAGLPVSVHAIGDQANRNVLDAIEAVRKQGIGPQLRHRIEHAQVLHPSDIPRFAQLGIVASPQPIHATQDMKIVDAYWGKRGKGAYAFRSLLESGAVLALGSDAPVETPDVMVGLHAATTRCRADGTPGGDGWYPEQKLTIDEAVRGYTVGAAYAVGMEDRQGKLAPGMLADLVVLSQDIFSINPMAILETEIEMTMVGGEWVFGVQ
ncbi:MAG: amidohydrolase [Caldilineaceae bacterium]